ncbi:MAG TPA: nitroreductase family protein, partial [Thermoanaerobaculia bacterium]
SVPALMEMLVEYGTGRPGALDFPLRAVTMSGDWIPPRLPDRIRAAFPGIQIVSMGGATEASIWSIHYPIGEVPAEWVSIPYGRPMRNQTFFVLDRDLEPRPVGVQGHLYIGGIGLAKGYWRDAEKTRAQFLTHPRTGEPLYRTGDLGRMLPDGNIEFLGRDDFQVKIQGHRIELGEIESALAQHPAVSAAVVTAHGDLRGAKQLVGYVVLKKPGEGMEEALRREEGQAWADLPAAVGAPAAHLARRRFHRTPVPLEDVGAVLGSLLRVEIEGSPFPKHRYGSAGNLYPVQAYLYAAPGKVEGLAGGAYYYDPSGHGLVLLAEGAAVEPSLFSPADREVFEEAGFAIFLVARLAAIAPLYGALARRFVAIESGLMSELLAGAAAEHGLGLSPAEGRLGELRGVLRLEESHEPMRALLGGFIDPDREAPAPEPFADQEEDGPAPAVTVLTDPIERLRFKMAHHGLRGDEGRPRIELPKPRLTPERIESLYVARRSYRRFPGEEAVPLADLGALLATLPSQEEMPALDLLLYVKPGRVEGLAGGTYAYEPEAHRLTLLEEGATLTSSLYDPANHDVFERAGLALLFVARAGSLRTGRDRRRAALEAGRRAQTLETAAPALRIGLAQMGGLRLDPVRTFFHLEAGDELMHTLLGGRIAADQTRTAAYLAEVAEYHAMADGLGETSRAAAPARQGTDVLAEIREFLRGKVPEYMVPAHLMRLDALPLSSNGKVDRKALPEPETLRPSDAPADGSYVAPETDVERVIADVVSQVLGLPRVGVHDNFFDLGANSVHVVRVHNALHAALGREISLMDMFNHPSVHRLARHLGESDGGAAAAPVPSQAEERSERLREGKDWRKQRLQKRQTDRG